MAANAPATVFGTPRATGRVKLLRGFRAFRQPSWLAVALASVALHSLLLALFLAAHRGDPSVLVCVKPSKVGTYPFEKATTGLGEAGGYDGQFYYALARSPWHVHGSDDIDTPARHARIVYPALCWLFSGGDPATLFWVMPLVNLLAVGILGALGAYFARTSGLSSWWGLLLPNVVSADLSLFRDLTDLVSACAVATLLIGRLRNWHPALVCLAAGASVFCREQNVVVVGAVLARTLWEVRWRTAAGLAAVLLAWASWFISLRLVYGVWPLLPAQGNLAEPLAGLRFALTHLGEARITVLVNLGCLLTLAGDVVLLAFAVRRGLEPALLLTALAGVGLVLVAGEQVYKDWWAFMRVFAWLPLALWFGSVQKKKRWEIALLSLPGLLPVYYTAHVLYMTR